MRRLALLILVLIVSSIGCHPLYGFIESEFTLAPESRLPRCFTIPAGYVRKDLTMTITLYTHPFSDRAKIVIRGPAPENAVLMKKSGRYREHPLTEQQEYNKYPQYFVIKIDGIDEVFKQKQPGPIVNITDDPKVTNISSQ